MLSLKDLNELLEKIPIWKRMKDAPDRIDRLEKRLKSIEDRMSGTGELCPFCKEPTLELIEIRPDVHLGILGVNKGFYKCRSCGKTLDKEIKD